MDYAGRDSLSSYAMSLTPFQFIPDLEETNGTRVVWNFGDGTISKKFSPSKYYIFPGVYNVELVVYNCDNNAEISTFTKTLTIHDYTSYTFTLSSYPNWDSMMTGRMNGPIIFQSTYPPYQPTASIFCTVSGSPSFNYWDINTEKYYHLKSFHGLYEKQYNYSLSAYDYIPIKSIDFTPDYIFGKISGDTIIECLSSDPDAYIIGSRGTKEVYYREDISSEYQLQFKFDKTATVLPDKYVTKDYINNLGMTVGATFYSSPLVQFSITSNGIDGEENQLDTFNIYPIKYYNKSFPFVIKIKDSDWFTVKNSQLFTVLDLNNVKIYDTNGTVYYSSDNGDFYPLGSDSYTGSAHVEVIPYAAVDAEPLYNVCIGVSATIYDDSMAAYNITGESSKFNIYPIGYFDIYKKNENFDAKETLKDLRFQETLLEKTRLFDEFLGDIMGTITSDHDTIGLKLYEKIANFVQNTVDIDTCENEFIHSLAQEMGYNDVGEEQYDFPIKIKRWIDLFSINKNRLFGETNKFDENLDIRGRTTKTEYGVNIGDRIVNPQTYMISVSSPIVALEKFSNTYTVLNPEQPVNEFKNLWRILNENVDARLTSDNLSSATTLYQGASLSTFRPKNPNNFLYGLDTSGWASYNFGVSYPGIAITRRHVIFPYHWENPPPLRPPLGGKFYFYDESGNLEIGLTLDKRRVSNSDITVVLLSSDLPSTIRPVRIASSTFFRTLSTCAAISSRTRTAMVGLNQYEQLAVRDLHIDYTYPSTSPYVKSNFWEAFEPTDSNRLLYYANLSEGDSGSPVSFIYNNDLLYVGHATSGDAGAGPVASAFITGLSGIEDTINELNIANSVVGSYPLSVVEPDLDPVITQYPLSSYESDWGWPLVLPTPFDFIDIDKYYTFFEYIPQYDSTILDGVIDFDNPQTTIPINSTYTMLTSSYGIYEHIILDTLYQSLSLI